MSLGKKVFRRFDRIIDENDNFSKMNRARDFRAKYKTNISEAEFLFLKQIYTEESALRKTCYRNNLENIILQDVTTCMVYRVQSRYVLSTTCFCKYFEMIYKKKKL